MKYYIDINLAFLRFFVNRVHVFMDFLFILPDAFGDFGSFVKLAMQEVFSYGTEFIPG